MININLLFSWWYQASDQVRLNFNYTIFDYTAKCNNWKKKQLKYVVIVGARVILACRNLEKANKALEEIRNTSSSKYVLII